MWENRVDLFLPYGIAEGRVLIIAPQLTIIDTIEESLDSGSAITFVTAGYN